jgi:hypothetical protein
MGDNRGRSKRVVLTHVTASGDLAYVTGTTIPATPEDIEQLNTLRAARKRTPEPL